MIDVSIDGENAVFEVEGWDKLWSLRSRLQIPLEHISKVYADPEPAMGWFDSVKIAGAAIPNIFRAGIFYQHGRFVFWDVRHAEKTIVVELDHEHFDKLVIEVEDPAATVQLLVDAKQKS